MADEQAPAEDARTVFQPTPGPGPVRPPARPASMSGTVEVGTVLNNIYQVTRLIGRGGMGEVWEGANLASEERVAIKLILPSLAADENVQAMFRKEARILTRLQHPALVQYRVLAQEPTLGLLYIVTEYIDGPPLSDELGKLSFGGDQLRGLARRLAEGLGAAHELGAVHRDMSPDNVLLPGDRLDRAKVIDFGIAKDLDPTKRTIVGDGFAGKLGYVAPEQFGDYGREIGPWTDVYSLGLVILAAAQGRNVDMGVTLVDAIERRRAGPDLSAAPPELRPVLQRMLQPDPALRLRSMADVIAALDAPPPGPAASSTAEAPTVFQPGSANPAAPAWPARSRGEGGKAPPVPALIGAVVLAALLIGGLAFLVLGKAPQKPQASASVAPVAAPARVTPQGGPPSSEAARKAIEAAFPAIACTWLDLTDLKGGQGAISLKFAGVAGDPAAAQAAVTAAAAKAGARVADADLEEVAPVQSTVCAPLDAFRKVRADTSAAGRRLSAPQRTFVMTKQDNGKVAGRAIVNMALRDPTLDFALYGLEPTGKIDAIIPSRAAFAAIPKDGQAVADMGGDSYRLQIDTDHQGWSGLLLLTGKGPFDPTLLAAAPKSRGPDWPARFKSAAEKGGWKAEMIWYKTVAS